MEWRIRDMHQKSRVEGKSGHPGVWVRAPRGLAFRLPGLLSKGGSKGGWGASNDTPSWRTALKAKDAAILLNGQEGKKPRDSPTAKQSCETLQDTGLKQSAWG